MVGSYSVEHAFKIDISLQHNHSQKTANTEPCNGVFYDLLHFYILQMFYYYSFDKTNGEIRARVNHPGKYNYKYKQINNMEQNL